MQTNFYKKVQGIKALNFKFFIKNLQKIQTKHTQLNSNSNQTKKKFLFNKQILAH